MLNFAMQTKNNSNINNSPRHHGKVKDMNVYELVRCELDERNNSYKDITVGFFSKPEYIIGYLTKDGKSSIKLSLLGHNSADNQYIKDYIGSPNAIIVVKDISDGIPLIGLQPTEDIYYYYTRKHEVREYGFFSHQ